ncbi:MAG: putative Ig domain-containing protein [Synergistaceae bacterium]|nr:putative Ig domain-containing protein [Synergistaceae bacterium]
MYIEAENIIAEAKYFTDEGTISIPGGGYTIVSDDALDGVSSKTVLDNVASGRDMTFGLKVHPSVNHPSVSGGSKNYIGSTFMEYEVTDDSGKAVAFTGGAETGLNGRNISWTFPADLSMDGSATLPNFKSTAEQLAGIVPYVEAVSSDGNLTALNYRLVASNDTSTAVTPSYRTDFRFYIESRDFEAGKAVRIFRGDWLNNSYSGTFTFSEPIPMEQIYNVQVRLRSYEDSRRPVYIWHFFIAEALEITTATLPAATQNAPYTATLAANLTGATWSVISGSLPDGLTLSTSGTISGSPTTAGTSTFTVKAEKDSQSAEKQLSITVSATPTITITTTSLPSGTLNTAYSATLAASITGANWSVISGTLPAGLSLNSSTGVISGTPITAGTSTFTVRATYSTASAEKQFTITISDITPVPVTTLTITTSSLPDGTAGTAYSATLAANLSGVTWSVISGTLPAGLTLNSSTGAITGTPTAEGTSSFTVRAVSGSQSAEKSFTVNIAQGVIGIGGGTSGGCESGLSVCGLLLLAIFLKKR